MRKIKKEVREKRGWSCARVSTKSQGNVLYGSNEQQKNMIERFLAQHAKNKGIEYIVVRTIEEEKSGNRNKHHLRTEFQELLEAVRSKKIDFVVFEKIDRISRWQKANLELIEAAAENDIEILLAEDGKELNYYKDRGSRLVFNAKNSWAEEYSLELEEKVTKKMREARVNNGKDSSTAPILGLDSHPTKVGFYVINPEEQEIVKDIFSQFILTGELFATADYCNSKGYRTKKRTIKEKIDKDGNRVPAREVGGEPFDSRTLRSLLSSSKIRGFDFFEDTWNQFPSLQDENGMIRWEYGHFKESGPVVPLELFNQAQAILEKNKQKISKPESKGEVYLLSGILQKADGTMLVGASGKGGEYRYYEDRKKGAQTTVRIPKEDIEKFISSRVHQYLKDGNLLERIVQNSVGKRDSEVEKIDRELELKNKNATELQRAVEGFRSHLRTAAKDGSLDKVLKMITDEQERATAELTILQDQIEALESRKLALRKHFEKTTLQEKIRQALSNFTKRCDLQKQQIIQAIIPKIIIHPNNKLEIVINPLFRATPEGGGSKNSVNGGKKFVLDKNGSEGGTRTPDPAVNSRLLYRLSYF